MARIRAHDVSMSLDGFMAGPRQSLTDPLGVGGEQLHAWAFGPDGPPSDPVDARFRAAGQEGVGATLMGRNMFGPVRGPWPDLSWTGWWGADPPFQHDVVVLTHHARPDVVMEGGTTFRFVTDGVEAGLQRALDAAAGRDVRVGGGAATLRACLSAGLLDELHVVVVPVLLGGGERLFAEADGTPVVPPSGYDCAEVVSTSVTHVRLVRR